MNLKDLKNYSNNTSRESLKTISEKLNSSELVIESVKENTRLVHPVDYTNPANFALYGSAEKYYLDTIKSIYSTYPYDGSKKEKQEWRNSASDLDLFFIDNIYPKSTGYVTIGSASFYANQTQVDSTELVEDGASNYKIYFKSNTPEYIKFYGGPNAGDTFQKSNIIDESTNRFSNLGINGNIGNTIEFWYKREVDDPFLKSHALVDIWNGLPISNPSYGRFLIESLENEQSSIDTIAVTYVSGANKSHRAATFNIEANLSHNWHHYAISVVNTASTDLKVSLYIDGQLEESKVISNAAIATPNSLAITGTIGAYQHNIYKNGNTISLSPQTGSVYASFDEFRFWKEPRDEKEIVENLYNHIGGGTNTDDENLTLGVYYKFNEGKTNISYVEEGQTVYVDSVCLDYSGRISNGSIVNYNSGIRNLGSAIEQFNPNIFEPKDPIVYKTHPDVQALIEKYQYSGSLHDTENVNSLINSIPSWIIEEETNQGANEVSNFIQILSSYFDHLHNQIKFLTSIKENNYLPGTYKTYPIYAKILSSYDFDISDLFSEATFAEYFLSKNDSMNFEKNLNQIKNEIYKNIYNNLSYIYKSKGTIKSFRNLLRCFGVDESILKLNIYSDNAEYELKNRFEESTIIKKFIDFNLSKASTIFSRDAIPNETDEGQYIPYINDNYFTLIPHTLEVEAIFPKKYDIKFQSIDQGLPNNSLTSSIFGVHTPNISGPNYSWSSPDSYNFQVFAVRPNIDSKDVKFVLSSSAFNFRIESENIPNVYENERWNFAVRIKKENYGVTDYINNFIPTTNYTIDLYGVSVLSDTINKSFHISQSIPNATAQSALKTNKTVYIGAHRTNFSGDILQYSDVKIGSVRYWLNYLSNEEIQNHAIDPTSCGIKNPSKNAFFNIKQLRPYNIPNEETLILHWDFDNVEKSDQSGELDVYDTAFKQKQPAKGVFSDLFFNKNSGHGQAFAANTEIVSIEYLSAVKNKMPETLVGSEMIKILEDESIRTEKTINPISYHIAFEKSMYQTISEDMMKLFSSMSDLNTLIGHPINRHREEYKDLEFFRKNYFNSLEETPNLEKYIEFYKWIDSSILDMIKKLVPASSKMAKNLSNTVESHMLERNKINVKKAYGFLSNDSDTNIFFSEATPIYSDLRTPYLDNKPWQSPAGETWLKKRVERTNPQVSSGNLEIDLAREYLRKVIYHTNINKPLSGYDYINDIVYSVNQDKNKIFTKTVEIFGEVENKVAVNKLSAVKDMYSAGLQFNLAFSSAVSGSYNDIALNKRKIYAAIPSMENNNSDYVLPFSIYTNVLTNQNYISNIHDDTYSNSNEIGLQGPFTNAHVGGNQHRHIEINSVERKELYLTDGQTYVSGSNELRSIFYRDNRTKRPLNIANIKTKSENITLGNYSKGYEIVSISGRSDQNLDLVHSGSYNPQVVQSNNSLFKEKQLNTRQNNSTVIVTKFSTPGAETSGRLSNDLNSEEYSAYNSINNRNYKVRKYLNKWDGNKSNIDTLPSIHKVVNNPNYMQASSSIGYQTEKKFDNNFVQNQIPRSDRQYSWITASVIGNIVGSGFINTKKPNIDYSSYHQFITGSFNNLGFMSSNFQAGAAYQLVNINTGSNVISYASNVGDLTYNFQRAYLTRNNGPYQYPSWKQIRNYENPLVRSDRNNNKVSLSYSDNLRNILTIKYKEPVFEINYPISQDIIDLGNNTTINIDSEYDNISSSFSNENLVERIKGIGYESNFDSLVEYEKYKNLYMNVPEVFKFREIEYKDRLFPRSDKNGLKEIITKPDYMEISGNGSNGRDRNVASIRSFWRNLISDRARSTTVATSSAGYIQKEQVSTTVTGKTIDLNNIEKGLTQKTISTTFDPNNTSSILAVDSQEVTINYGSARVSADNPSSIKGELVSYTEFESINHIVYQGGTKTSNNYWVYDNNEYANRYIPRPQLFYINASPKFEISGISEEYTITYTTGSVYKMHLSGKTPAYDTYEKYFEDMKPHAYNYGHIPEYKFSDYADYYFRQRKGNLYAYITSSYLTLDGSRANYSNINQNFNSTNTLKTFLLKDFEDKNVNKKLSIKVEGLKKLLPYKGFYPAERTVQLFKEFWKSWTGLEDGALNNIAKYFRVHPMAQTLPTGSGHKEKFASGETNSPPPDHQMMALIQPLFAPGILFNALKSGIAVDWPAMIYSSYYQYPSADGNYKNGYTNYPPFYNTYPDATNNKRYLKDSGGSTIEATPGGTSVQWEPLISTDYTFRFPFESLIEFDTSIPKKFFNKDRSLYYLNPSLYSNSIRSTGRSNHRFPYYYLGNVSGSLNSNFQFRDQAYKLAMHNFLAEVPNFFLKNSALNTFSSRQQNEGFYVNSGTLYQMDVVLSRKIDNDIYKFISKFGPRNHYGPPGDMHSTSSYTEKTTGYLNMVINDYVSNYSMLAHSPPYFYGDSVVTIKFTPKDTRNYSIKEIIAAAKVEKNDEDIKNNILKALDNIDPSEGDWHYYPQFNENGINKNLITGSIAFRNKMPLEASVNLFGVAKEKVVQFDQFGNPMTVSDIASDHMDTWVIQPKWECPILTTSNKWTYWSEYGQEPEQDESLILQIKETEQQLNIPWLPPSASLAWGGFFDFPGVGFGGGGIRPFGGSYINETWYSTQGQGYLYYQNNNFLGFDLEDYYPQTYGDANFSDNIVDGGYIQRRPVKKKLVTDSRITTGSLIELCGFKADSKKLGVIAEQKIISEAIIMIPYTYKQNNKFASRFSRSRIYSKFRTIRDRRLKNLGYNPETADTILPLMGENGVFSDRFSALINKPSYFAVDKQKLNKLIGLDVSSRKLTLEQIKNKLEDSNLNQENSIIQTMRKMMEYNIPSHLDWVTNKNVDPFVMYIFEFNSTLDKEDLTDIWQGLMPKIAQTVEKETVTIEHQLGEFDFFHGKELQDDIKWKIFKVKKKANNNYYNLTSDSKDDKRFKFKFSNATEKQPEYSYNWPYDFFSLVEMANVDTSIKITDDAPPKYNIFMKDRWTKAVKNVFVRRRPFDNDIISSRREEIFAKKQAHRQTINNFVVQNTKYTKSLYE